MREASESACRFQCSGDNARHAMSRFRAPGRYQIGSQPIPAQRGQKCLNFFQLTCPPPSDVSAAVQQQFMPKCARINEFGPHVTISASAMAQSAAHSLMEGDRLILRPIAGAKFIPCHQRQHRLLDKIGTSVPASPKPAVKSISMPFPVCAGEVRKCSRAGRPAASSR